jgi:hypothetical protein
LESTGMMWNTEKPNKSPILLVINDWSYWKPDLPLRAFLIC